MRHDITFPLYIEVDRICSLACPASPVHYQFDPVQTAKTGVVGAINILGLTNWLRIRILRASKREVHGDSDVRPQREDYWGHVSPIGPRSCYVDDLVDGLIAMTGCDGFGGPVNLGKPQELSIADLAALLKNLI